MSPAEAINESSNQSRSTGPRTPEGKAISSLNAMRHGLTGRVVVLPSEDMNVYHAFCAELMAELAPETPLERQYAQTFCDTQWRLNRARSYEDGMLTLGHLEQSDSIGVEHPEALAALTAAKAFRENSKAFVNLSLYEQRLQRAQKEALRQLQELQARRIAAKQAAEKDKADAAPLHNLHKMKARANEPAANQTPRQFVCSSTEIEREAHLEDLSADTPNTPSGDEFPLRHTA